jgi:hypothetical protein
MQADMRPEDFDRQHADGDELTWARTGSAGRVRRGA